MNRLPKIRSLIKPCPIGQCRRHLTVGVCNAGSSGQLPPTVPVNVYGQIDPLEQYGEFNVNKRCNNNSTWGPWGGGGGAPEGITYIKEGVLLRNVSAAPICNHFTVVTPGCWIREVCLF